MKPTKAELLAAQNWLRQGAPVANGHARASVQTLLLLVECQLDQMGEAPASVPTAERRSA